MRRIFASLLLALSPLSARAADAIRQLADPGLSVVYARLFTSNTAALTFTLGEGSSHGVGRYAVPEGTVDDTLTTPGIYSYKVFVGAAPSATADDQWIGSGTLYWSGTTALTEAQYLLLMTTSNTGANTWGLALHNLRQFFGSNTDGEATEDGLQNAPSGGGGSSDTVAATSVIDSRTWYPDPADGSKAVNIVTVKVGFHGTLAVAPPLNADADIDTIEGVDITDPDDDPVAATELTQTADGRRMHFDVPTLTVPGVYLVVPSVNTIDGQTLPMECKLRVRP